MGDAGGIDFFWPVSVTLTVTPYAAAVRLRGWERLRSWLLTVMAFRASVISCVAASSIGFVRRVLRETDGRRALRLPEYGECGPAAVDGLCNATQLK